MFSPTFTSLLALATFASGVTAACNRTALLEFADAYVFAHENGRYPAFVSFYEREREEKTVVICVDNCTSTDCVKIRPSELSREHRR